MDELIEKTQKIGQKWPKLAINIQNWPKFENEKYPENLKRDRIQSS